MSATWTTKLNRLDPFAEEIQDAVVPIVDVFYDELFQVLRSSGWNRSQWTEPGTRDALRRDVKSLLESHLQSTTIPTPTTTGLHDGFTIHIQCLRVYPPCFHVNRVSGSYLSHLTPGIDTVKCAECGHNLFTVICGVP